MGVAVTCLQEFKKMPGSHPTDLVHVPGHCNQKELKRLTLPAQASPKVKAKETAVPFQKVPALLQILPLSSLEQHQAKKGVATD